MCFNIRANISKTDRICYKRFRKQGNKYITPYQEMEWDPESTQNAVNFSVRYGGYGEIEISQGLHAYVNEELANVSRTDDQVVIKMIIPAGTYYFENSKEIVALRIRMANAPITKKKKQVKKVNKVKKKLIPKKKNGSNTNTSNRKARKRKK